MADQYNVEAFNRLVDGYLMSGVQKEQLLNAINFNSEDMWLKKIYLAKIKTIEEQSAAMIDEEVRKETLF